MGLKRGLIIFVCLSLIFSIIFSININFVSATLGDNLVVNGDFSNNNYNSWSFSNAENASIDYHIDGVYSNKSLTIGGKGNIFTYQSVNLEAGKSYNLSFVALRQGSPASSVTIQRSDNWQTIDKIDVPDTSNNFVLFSKIVNVPTSGSYKLVLNNGNNLTGSWTNSYFDNIKLVEVASITSPPTPPTTTPTDCVDSDMNETYPLGVNPYVKGTATITTTSKTDECIDRTHVREYYCSTPKGILDSPFTCQSAYICANGRCVTNLLTNGDFSNNNYNSWSFSNAKNVSIDYFIDTRFSNKSLVINGKGNIFAYQSVNLEAGKNYNLSFIALRQGSPTSVVAIQGPGEGWQTIDKIDVPDTSTNFMLFSKIISVTTSGSYKLVLNNGNNVSGLTNSYFDNIKLVEIDFTPASSLNVPFDTDNGKDYGVNGACVDYDANQERIEHRDICDADVAGGGGQANWLWEQFLENGKCTYELYKCSDVGKTCVDGKCVLAGERSECWSKAQPTKRVPVRTRERVGDKIWYCDPITSEYIQAKANEGDCVTDYECESNVCIDSKCTSIRGELEVQGKLIKEIWCWIQGVIPGGDSQEECRTKFGIA